MRIVLQRVSSAVVRVDGREVSRIGKGFLLLVGVGRKEREEDVRWLARKCVGLRIFEDDEGKMNLSLGDVGGSILAVSQFTLYADCKKGKRPSFVDAAPFEEGRQWFRIFVNELKACGVVVEEGVYGAKMGVSVGNDGPVSLMLDAEELRC